MQKIFKVNLYVRVWIETNLPPARKMALPVTLYVRVWIETLIRECLPCKSISHPLREGVDWNKVPLRTLWEDYGHHLREGVDWNDWAWPLCFVLYVTLYVRVWIETPLTNPPASTLQSPSTWGCGMKLGKDEHTEYAKPSPSTWGCGLKLRGLLACRRYT